jgi:osmotically-inducible protein OsmY
LLLLSLLLALVVAPATGWSVDYVADSAITDRLETEFRFDPVVPFDTIDVRTDQGVVTLTGWATNLLAKERATRISESLRGVRAVINRIDVDPVLDRSADQLSGAVEQALAYDTATDAYEISVTADDTGGVTLSGTVDSWAESDLAETVAKGVSGVVRVRNDIDVKPQSERPDSEIEWEIEKRLFWDTLVDDGLISVRVEDGEVSLFGTVGSAAEKTRAEWDAWGITGVKAVDSSPLKVEKWARDEALREHKYVARSDQEIRDAVQDALLYDPRVFGHDIEIKVTNGMVTLRGVVDNIQARKAVERDARNTVGVLGVNSLIKVRPIDKLSDAQLADNVSGALARNPFLSGDDITVEAEGQVVTLDGDVNSYFEKAEAENVAYRAAGVAEARNRLRVRHLGAHL